MGQPLADQIEINLFYFDGAYYMYLGTLSTNEEGVVTFGGLIVGEYYFNCTGVSTITFLGEILESTNNLNVGVVLIPPICILIYRKNRRIRRIIAVRDCFLTINIL